MSLKPFGVAALGLSSTVVLWASLAEAPRVSADPAVVFADLDGDFVPDAIEWALLSKGTQVDSDLDGVEDFLELVQRTIPSQPNLPLPADHEVRVATTMQHGFGGHRWVWLHIMIRIMGDLDDVSRLEPWVEISAWNLRIPLGGAMGRMIVNQRTVANEGNWYVLSAPLVTESYLQFFLPCTFGAEATIGQRELKSGVHLFEQQGDVWSLVPMGPEVGMQTIAHEPPPGGGSSNKLCVLEMEEVGATPTGSKMYRVTDAECKNANDLECGAGCPDTEGWVFTLPDGVGPVLN